jgi:hypothetical protein
MPTQGAHVVEYSPLVLRTARRLRGLRAVSRRRPNIVSPGFRGWMPRFAVSHCHDGVGRSTCRGHSIHWAVVGGARVRARVVLLAAALFEKVLAGLFGDEKEGRRPSPGKPHAAAPPLAALVAALRVPSSPRWPSWGVNGCYATNEKQGTGGGASSRRRRE